MSSQFNSTSHTVEDDEMSAEEIWHAISQRKWLIFFATLISAALSIGVSFALTPTFRAEVLIAPAKDNDGKGGLSALAGQFGGLANLAGVNLGGSGNRSEAVATLGSRALTEKYISSQNLMPLLFKTKWDSQRNEWKVGLSRNPQLWDASKLFNKEIRKIAEDKKTGLVTLSIEWRDAEQAAQWANDLVKLANQTLRDRAIAESTRNLAYLNDQLEKASVVELRQAVYRLIESEVKNVMIAQGSEEYAFKIIDPAVAPLEKSFPKRSVITLVGTALGLMLASFFAVMTRRKP